MEGVASQVAGQHSSGSSVAPAEVSKRALSSLKRKYFFVKKISKNFAELERNERYLRNEEEDAIIRLDRNREYMEKTSKCETWLTEVDKLKAEIENLRTNYRNTRKFLGGIYPFSDLLKLSQQIVEKTAETVFLINQIGQITIMVEKKELDRVMKKTHVLSLKEHVETLHECLRNEELKRICIWGPPGVGKTTIMEKLFDVVGTSDEFDIRFWVTVNKEGNEKDIQKALLRRLNISAEYCRDEEKADMISQVLENKRYVLFIDEVFSKLDLKSIGIKDKHKCGKVVCAGRYRDICGQADEDIYVERLSDEDAQNLFWEIVGGHLKNNQEINPVAETIIEECCGMPHFLKLLGNYLAEVKDPSTWRDILVQLRSPLEQEIHERPPTVTSSQGSLNIKPEQEIQKISPTATSGQGLPAIKPKQGIQKILPTTTSGQSTPDMKPEQEIEERSRTVHFSADLPGIKSKQKIEKRPPTIRFSADSSGIKAKQEIDEGPLTMISRENFPNIRSEQEIEAKPSAIPSSKKALAIKPEKEIEKRPRTIHFSADSPGIKSKQEIDEGSPTMVFSGKLLDIESTQEIPSSKEKLATKPHSRYDLPGIKSKLDESTMLFGEKLPNIKSAQEIPPSKEMLATQPQQEIEKRPQAKHSRYDIPGIKPKLDESTMLFGEKLPNIESTQEIPPSKEMLATQPQKEIEKRPQAKHSRYDIPGIKPKLDESTMLFGEKLPNIESKQEVEEKL